MELFILIMFIASNVLTWYLTSAYYRRQERKRLEAKGEVPPEFVWGEDAVSDLADVRIKLYSQYCESRNTLSDFAKEALEERRDYWHCGGHMPKDLTLFAKVCRYLGHRLIVVKEKDLDKVKKALLSVVFFLLSGGALLSIIAFFILRVQDN